MANDQSSEMKSENMAMRHSKLAPGRVNRLKKALSLPMKRKGGVVLPAQQMPMQGDAGNG